MKNVTEIFQLENMVEVSANRKWIDDRLKLSYMIHYPIPKVCDKYQVANHYGC